MAIIRSPEEGSSGWNGWREEEEEEEEEGGVGGGDEGVQHMQIQPTEITTRGIWEEGTSVVSRVEKNEFASQVRRRGRGREEGKEGEDIEMMKPIQKKIIYIKWER